MILFVHGIKQCAGVFLPLIKNLVGDSQLLEDKLLLDSFCLWLPGYDKKDRDFDYKYIENEIYEFIEQKKQIQSEISAKLVLSNSNIPFRVIKDTKLNIIGCDIGAGIALNFAAQNPELVASTVMIDCGADFNNLRSKWFQISIARLIKQSRNVISRRYENETDIYKKIFLGNITSYPSVKGINSYLELYKSYNFASTFDKISIDQQQELSNVKILNLVDKKFGLSNNFNTKKIQTILDKKFKTVAKQGIFIKVRAHQNFESQQVSIGAQSILDPQVAYNLSEKIKEFYN